MGMRWSTSWDSTQALRPFYRRGQHRVRLDNAGPCSHPCGSKGNSDADKETWSFKGIVARIQSFLAQFDRAGDMNEIKVRDDFLAQLWNKFDGLQTLLAVNEHEAFASHSKKIQKFVCPTMSPRQQWTPRRTKNGDLSTDSSVQGTGGSPTGLDPENRVGDQDSFFRVASPRWAGALSCKNKTALVTLPRRFSFKISFSCTSRNY